MIINQVPHWLFPIAGQISVTVPRLLLITESINRSTILELLRLNSSQTYFAEK